VGVNLGDDSSSFAGRGGQPLHGPGADVSGCEYAGDARRKVRRRYTSRPGVWWRIATRQHESVRVERQVSGKPSTPRSSTDEEEQAGCRDRLLCAGVEVLDDDGFQVAHTDCAEHLRAGPH
jgi:hypothetical protein